MSETNEVTFLLPAVWTEAGQQNPTMRLKITADFDGKEGYLRFDADHGSHVHRMIVRDHADGAVWDAIKEAIDIARGGERR